MSAGADDKPTGDDGLDDAGRTPVHPHAAPGGSPVPGVPGDDGGHAGIRPDAPPPVPRGQHATGYTKAGNLGDPDGLNLKERAFWQAYCSNGHVISRAYITAYGDHIDARAAASRGCALLNEPVFRKLLARMKNTVIVRTSRALAKYYLDQEKLAEEMSRIAFANVLDYVTFNARGEPIFDHTKIDRDTAAGLVSLEIDERSIGTGDRQKIVRRVKFRIGDKKGALETLMRMQGMFPEAERGDKAPPLTPELDATIEEKRRRIFARLAEMAEPVGVTATAPVINPDGSDA